MRLRWIVRKILGRRKSGLVSELSTPAIHRASVRAIKVAAPQGIAGDHLDIGSGSGDLLKLIAARYPVGSFACDYTDKLMRLPHQPVQIVDLNHDALPYSSNRFALVTCVETIEHLEHYRETIRDIYRVLKPGGLVILSTPNVLNLRSRLHYLSSGFPNLFGPLAVGGRDVHSPRGHINPVGLFYLVHALLEAGFVELKLSVDHYQRRSLILFFLLFPPIRLASKLNYRRELKKYRTIDPQNDWIVRAMNSRDILLGRTLIVTAQKPR
jgi:SAM-dependent methyltransferase